MMEMSEPSVKMSPTHFALLQSIDTNEFVQGYIDAALKSSAFSSAMSAADLSEDTLTLMVIDCQNFQRNMGHLMSRPEMCDALQCGEDFWLSRHGLPGGFLSHGYDRDVTEALILAAKSYGRMRLYLKDGVIYQ